jgi:MFS transporter, CP family, cyanate transporter
LQKSPWIVLGCISTMVLLLYVLMQCIPPLLPSMILEFRVSHSAGGFLYATPILMIALLSYPLGIGSDYLGTAKALSLGVAIAVLGSLFRAVASNFTFLVLFTALFGLGFALCFPNLSKAVKEHFPASQVGKVTAIYTAAIPFGSGLGISLSKPILVLVGNWRDVVVALTAIAILLIGLCGAVIYYAGKKGPPNTGRVPSASSKQDGETLRVQPPTSRSILPVVICGLLLGLLNFVFFITIGWLPTYLMDSGWEPVSAGAVTSMISFVEIPAILLFPYLAEWTGRQRLLILVNFFVICACSLAVSLEPAWAWAVSPFLGIAFGGTFVLLVAFPAQFSPRHKVGRAAGANLSIGYLGALLGPPIAGHLKDVTGDFTAAFLVAALAAAVAMGLSFSFPKSTSYRAHS